jgi:hypothetical protein
MNLKTISLPWQVRPTVNSNVSYQMSKDAYNGDSRGYLILEGPIHTWHCHFVHSQVLRTMSCCMFRAPFYVGTDGPSLTIDQNLKNGRLYDVVLLPSGAIGDLKKV